MAADISLNESYPSSVGQSGIAKRWERSKAWVNEKLPISALGVRLESMKFELRHNLWGVNGYFHTRPDQRYFYTIFRQKLLQIRAENMPTGRDLEKMNSTIRKLGDNAQEMGGVSDIDKVRLQEDAQYLAGLYEQSRINSSSGVGLRLSSELAKISRQGDQYRSPHE